jgi:hypothetical protein
MPLDETVELIFYVFGESSDTTKIDFMLFCRLFYLIYAKYCVQDDEFMTDNVDMTGMNDPFEKSDKNIIIFAPDEGDEYEEREEEEEDEY